MPLKKVFGAMPRPILVMFFVFLITPLASLTFIEPPWVVYRHDVLWRALLIGMTYWALPWGLCFAITLKHYLFLPLLKLTLPRLHPFRATVQTLLFLCQSSL